MTYVLVDRYGAKLHLRSRYGSNGCGGRPEAELFSNKQLEVLVDIIGEVFGNYVTMNPSVPQPPPITAEQVLELFMKRLVEHDYTGTDQG